MITTPPLAPADMLALVNEAEQPRPINAGIDRRKLGHLLHLAAENDERGIDALIALAVHNNRYPKVKS